ncbi:FCD domain-containing protein [Ruegeria sp. 2205SS24-7]|uniref:FCD domain-containing protein n=1 Tax=Ruegeria discodermiae TaxID=3064389 RepID=UPI00274201E3|nr:FCD domain-containing protein [Ruegeria sp. 2205SS24-7]MDP5218938.1 FCD domain-containing protein [Ruegeria sp. 2205SS24-7]
MIDRQFQDDLAQHCGNSLTASSLSRLHTHMHLFRLRYHSSVARDATDEHQQIVEAIQARNPEVAKQAMRQHIETSRERMSP